MIIIVLCGGVYLTRERRALEMVRPLQRCAMPKIYFRYTCVILPEFWR
jgi:hypothetical protein